jgi:hypothetical protein
MAFLNLRLPAIGLTLLVATLPCGIAPAEKQSDFFLSGAPQMHAARQYSVGDLIPLSDGFPNRPDAILIIDGAVIALTDRVTRRVVEVLR